MALLSMEQMTGNPFLGLKKSKEAAAGGPITPEEIQEAQSLGIIPGPQNSIGKPIPPAIQRGLDAANGGQISAPVQAGPGPTQNPSATIGRRPVPTGADYVPRVQLSPEPAPESALSKSLAARREMYNKQLEDLNKPSDYSGLQNQMRQRSRASMDDTYAAALAGIGPDAIKGFQQPLLKQSLAARQPMKVEGGTIDETGRVMIDPAYQKAKQADQLRNRLAQLDQAEARQTSDQEKNALAHERNMVMLEMRRLGIANGFQNNSSTWGFAPDGRRIVEDRQGNQALINPDGSRSPYTGTGTQKAPFEKNAQTAMNLAGSVERVDALIAIAKKNPEAFGIKAALTSMTPDLVQQRLMPKVLTAEQLSARNYVQRQAAQEIHDIYGAALTLGEGQRASQWAIGPKDSIESVLSKLQSARDWAHQTRVAQGTAANAAATSRLGGTPQQPQAPGLPQGWTVREKPGG